MFIQPKHLYHINLYKINLDKLLALQNIFNDKKDIVTCTILPLTVTN